MLTNIDGTKFPAIRARNLDGKNVTLEQYFGIGEGLFLALGFTYQSQYQIYPWSKEVEQKYGHRLHSLTMAVYDTPMSKLARGWIDRSMAAGSSTAEHEHTLTTTDDAFIKKVLGITDRQLAYFYLIAPDGTVCWSHAGNITAQASAELEAAVKGLKSSQVI